jgi:hypothetical protein
MSKDRKQRSARSGMSASELANTPPIDYLRPIVADGDTGHGGLTAVMKVSILLFLFKSSFIEHSKYSSSRCLSKKGRLAFTSKTKRLEPKSVGTWRARCSFLYRVSASSYLCWVMVLKRPRFCRAHQPTCRYASAARYHAYKHPGNRSYRLRGCNPHHNAC